MVDRLKRKVGWVLLAVVAGLITSGLTATAVASPQVEHAQGAKTSKVAYHDEWRKLWEDHITWTRVVILGILDELPGTPAYVDRLLQNYEDMEASLAPYYGDEAEVLGDLIQDHLVIAAELLTAAHDGNTQDFEDAKARWYANAEDIATQMNLMNPRFWGLEEAREMWIDHLDATLDEASALLAGDYAAEVAAYDRVHDLALEMADFFSAGVIGQFPNEFSGPMPGFDH